MCIRRACLHKQWRQMAGSRETPRGVRMQKSDAARLQAPVSPASELELTRIRVLQYQPDVRVDGTIQYQTGWALRVPQGGGVYLISDMRGVLYVGLTSRLRRRFDEHADERDNALLRAA